MQCIDIQIRLKDRSKLSDKWFPQFLACLHSLIETYDIPVKDIVEISLHSTNSSICHHIYDGKLVGLEFPVRGSEINKNGKAGKKE